MWRAIKIWGIPPLFRNIAFIFTPHKVKIYAVSIEDVIIGLQRFPLLSALTTAANPDRMCALLPYTSLLLLYFVFVSFFKFGLNTHCQSIMALLQSWPCVPFLCKYNFEFKIQIPKSQLREVAIETVLKAVKHSKTWATTMSAWNLFNHCAKKVVSHFYCIENISIFSSLCQTKQLKWLIHPGFQCLLCLY